MVRPEVMELVRLGTLPSEADDEAALQRSESALHAITRPVSDDEARLLVNLFGSDDTYGLAWTLLHLIETAPGWPLEDCLLDPQNEWQHRLKRRAANAHRS